MTHVIQDPAAFVVRLRDEIGQDAAQYSKLDFKQKLRHRLHIKVLDRIENFTSDADFHVKYNAIMDELKSL